MSDPFPIRPGEPRWCLPLKELPLCRPLRGLRVFTTPNPALKRWAILGCSYGTMTYGGTRAYGGGKQAREWH